MKTALITSDTYKNHNTGDGHPEKIDRVTAVIDNFKKLDNKNLIWKKPSKFENSMFGQIQLNIPGCSLCHFMFHFMTWIPIRTIPATMGLTRQKKNL